MASNRIPDPARTMIEAYCNVNAYDMDGLRRSNTDRLEQFRAQLTALHDNRIDARDEYEALTGEDFDTIEDFLNRLHDLISHTQ